MDYKKVIQDLAIDMDCTEEQLIEAITSENIKLAINYQLEENGV